ncbi:MAG: LLM class F420-dependent oxidoreductase [Chloroflexota bacterium]
MRLGLQIPDFTMEGGPAQLGSHLASIARAADEAGFASLWVMDHFFQIAMAGPPEHEMLEAYTTLGYLAGVTSRVKLGTMVTGVTYRYPGLLAKTISTLDVLSGGRAYLGLGAAWNEQEHRGLGVPFPPTGERLARLEEALRVVLQMWSGEVGPFEGKFYQLAQTLNSPQPLSRPRPPILIGGGGEKKTLRLVAQYGDACNFFGDPPALRHKLEVLRQHCQEVGRDYEQIEKTCLGHFKVSAAGGDGAVTPAQLLETLSAQAQVGIQHSIFSLANVWDLEAIHLIGREVVRPAASL